MEVKEQSISSKEEIENENIEIALLLEAIFQKYGYDFRNYAKASLKRRIKHRLSLSQIESISEMQHRVLNDIIFFEKLLLDLSINVTEMFRDPSFYLALRHKVIPLLKKEPILKIWHAGCATGEEIYSMAILLKEEGLYDKTQIYATDFNEVVLKKAKTGVFTVDNIKEYTANYQKAGGKCSFSDYYVAKYDSVKMDQSLKKNVVFADHNLVTDWVFGEMNIVICRNVLIYFDRDLQDRVFKLFCESLCDGGVMCLGSRESVRFSKYSNSFEDFEEKENIYRKKKVLKKTYEIKKK